jgi:RimJ/RimL family protein N-acetyltransferase
MFSTQLFTAGRIRLDGLVPDQDGPVVAAWSHDLESARLSNQYPPRPLSVAQAARQLREWDKERREQRNAFPFAIRAVDEGRLLGLARLRPVRWARQSAQVWLTIGAASDRRQGYGGLALGLLVRYAFDELGLFQLTGHVAAYNAGGQAVLRKHGFRLEVTRRAAIGWRGRRWDELYFGLTAEGRKAP